MNSLLIGIAALILLGPGYRFYGKIAEKLWGTDPARPTPAIETPDGADYVPAKHRTILFGHHFASIWENKVANVPFTGTLAPLLSEMVLYPRRRRNA